MLKRASSSPVFPSKSLSRTSSEKKIYPIPLFMASLDGNETVVQALIVAGADVNKAADGGTTPLHIAA